MPRLALLAILVFVGAYLIPLACRPLVVVDEVRYAEIPREMLATGEWVVPRLAGLRYFHKPPLGYWLDAQAMSLLGPTRFALRLPSALSAGVMALCAGLLVARHGGGRRRGALVAMGVLGCALVHAIGTLNLLDALFSALVTAALCAFFESTRATARRAESGWLALFGALLGAAFLTKGFLAFVLAALVAAPFLLWERRFLAALRTSWIPITMALAVAAPWSIEIALREPTFWPHFLLVQNLGRFFDPGGQQHPEPFWYFVPVILGGALPWTPLAPIAWRARSWEPEQRSLRRFALCWLLLPFLFLSASSGKLATYVLPCVPPLVLLVASGAEAALEHGRRKAFDRVALALALLFCLLALAMALAAGAVLSAHATWLPVVYARGEWWRCALACGAGLGGAALFFVAVRHAEPTRKLACFACGALPVFASVLVLVPAVGSDRFPLAFLREAVDELPADPIVVAQDNLLHAACWLLERDDVLALGWPGEFEYGLSWPDAAGRHLEIEELRALLLDPMRTRPVVAFGVTDAGETWWQGMPAASWSRRLEDVFVAVFDAPAALSTARAESALEDRTPEFTARLVEIDR